MDSTAVHRGGSESVMFVNRICLTYGKLYMNLKDF